MTRGVYREDPRDAGAGSTRPLTLGSRRLRR
jgi:hypothetical protein